MTSMLVYTKLGYDKDSYHLLLPYSWGQPNMAGRRAPATGGVIMQA